MSNNLLDILNLFISLFETESKYPILKGMFFVIRQPHYIISVVVVTITVVME